MNADFLSKDDLFYQLMLLRSHRIGPVTFFHLIKRCGNAQNALEFLAKKNRERHREDSDRIMILPTTEDIQKEIENTRAYGADFLTIDDPSYPSFLKMIHDAPPILIYKGDKKLLQKQCFSIVGSRDASIAGKKIAYHLAHDLAHQDMVIVSGLARGIDASAHEGSLEKGTIAFINGGINQVYPQENKKLFALIEMQGVLVTEYPFNQEPVRELFLARNRLIAGISWGTLIVEAAAKSGSLNTAQHATDYNRQLFAVPGHPLEARAYGCNRLIQNGAILVQDLQDILLHRNRQNELNVKDRSEVHYRNLFEDTATYEENHYTHKEPLDTQQDSDGSLDALLLSALNAHIPTSIETLVSSLSDYPPSQIRSHLVILELENYIERYQKTDSFVKNKDDSGGWLGFSVGL